MKYPRQLLVTIWERIRYRWIPLTTLNTQLSSMYCGVTIMASESCSNESFMEEVRKYPWLYDKFCKDFKDKSLKLNSWKAVGDKYEYTGNYCRIPRYLTVFELPTSNTEYAQIPSNTVIWEVALMSTIGRKPTILWLRSGAAGQTVRSLCVTSFTSGGDWRVDTERIEHASRQGPYF